MSEENQEVVGVETFDAFMHVELKYWFTIVKSVAYFFNMVMKMLPLEDSSLLQPSKIEMREKNLLDVVQRQCVFTPVRVAPPHKRPLPDSGHRKKKKSRTFTPQESMAAEEASVGGEVDVA